MKAFALAFGLAASAAFVGCGDADDAPPTPTEPPPEVVCAEPTGPDDPAPEPEPEPEPHAVIRITPAEMRRQAWLESSFPCRAISTTRYRTCRFVTTDDGRVRIQFPLRAATCDDVQFGADGDPVALNDCRGNGLRIPADNPLSKLDGPREAWAGSQRGWSWDDGERYCCPGMWIMAPDDLPARTFE